MFYGMFLNVITQFSCTIKMVADRTPFGKQAGTCTSSNSNVYVVNVTSLNSKGLFSVV